jgi:predicted TIM-barrel fold metal-dependent hydrolase
MMNWAFAWPSLSPVAREGEHVQRRDFLKLVACSAGSIAFEPALTASPSPVPIIDGHIHLFDPSRPGGVPWPPPDDAVLYRPALPDRFAALAAPLGVVGAIAIEASPLASDNQWLLKVAAGHPVIVGVIGDLVPATASYLSDLERLHADPLFLGFRYGNLWNRDLSVDLQKPGFVGGLKALAQAGLVFESANPDPTLIRAILNAAQRVPDLRIVIDHLPHAEAPKEETARKEYWSNLSELAKSSRVFIKLSEIPVLANGSLVTDIGHYKGALDTIWGVFGEDRIFFGSDWPNGDHVASYQETLSIVRAYISEKSPTVSEKFFWKNSIAAYRWHRRMPNQPAM